MPKYNEPFGDGLKRIAAKQRSAATWQRKRTERMAADPVLKPHGSGGHVSADVPADVFADRDRRAAMEPTSLTASLCGDPLPGRSALDQRQPRVVVSND